MKNLIIKLCSFITYRILILKNKNLQIKNCSLYLLHISTQRNNKIAITNATLKRSRIIVNGNNNNINFQGRLWKTKILIDGNNNQLEIAPNTDFRLSQIIIRGNNCTIKIGTKTSFGSVYMICMGAYNSITIGDECMFAENIEIWNTDSHPIFNANGNIINPSKPIYIGSHIWCGKNSTILKGVKIGDNAVIGMQALVTKDINPNTLNVGIPAQTIREQINWKRDFINT